MVAGTGCPWVEEALRTVEVAWEEHQEVEPLERELALASPDSSVLVCWLGEGLDWWVLCRQTSDGVYLLETMDFEQPVISLMKRIKMAELKIWPTQLHDNLSRWPSCKSIGIVYISGLHAELGARGGKKNKIKGGGGGGGVRGC